LVGVAVNVTLVPEQIVVAVLAMLTAVATGGFTVIVMPLLVAEVVVTQLSEEVSWQETTSPLFSVDEVYVALFVPTGEPFTNHWYAGVPPLVGVAVKVTLVPAQIVVADAAIERAGVTGVVTDIVMTLLVAVLAVAQTALPVTTQPIVLPFANAALL
jgi:hypothetical protein